MLCFSRLHVWTQISNYVYFLFLPKIPNVHSILVNDNDRQFCSSEYM